MRHAQHGTKAQKKLSGHGLDRSGSDDWVEQGKVKIAKTPLYRQDTWFYVREMNVAWCGKRAFLRAIEIKTDVSKG